MNKDDIIKKWDGHLGFISSIKERLIRSIEFESDLDSVIQSAVEAERVKCRNIAEREIKKLVPMLTKPRTNYDEIYITSKEIQMFLTAIKEGSDENTL